MNELSFDTLKAVCLRRTYRYFTPSRERSQPSVVECTQLLASSVRNSLTEFCPSYLPILALVCVVRDERLNFGVDEDSPVPNGNAEAKRLGSTPSTTSFNTNLEKIGCKLILYKCKCYLPFIFPSTHQLPQFVIHLISHILSIN
jgi:hypothetical protein